MAGIVLTPAAFQESLAAPAPPAGLSPALRALWFAEKGDLDRALAAISGAEGEVTAWVAGHLHRASGDLPRARLWYGRAKRLFAMVPLEQERHNLIVGLLTAGD